MGAIQGIFFDLGNTLLDFGRLDMVQLFKRGARNAYSFLQGLDQPLPPFRKYFHRQLWAVRWRYALSRMIGREFNSLDVLAGISEDMGHSLSQEQVEELAWHWYEPLGQHASVEECLPGILQDFQADGLSLAVVSNTFVPGQVLDRHLQQTGLLEYFPTRIYSCDVRYRKPDKRIFDIALARTGLVGERAIFVGDSLKADVAGAARAGMISVLKDPTGKKHRRGVRPDYRITSLAQLPDILAGRRQQTSAGE